MWHGCREGFRSGTACGVCPQEVEASVKTAKAKKVEADAKKISAEAEKLRAESEVQRGSPGLVTGGGGSEDRKKGERKAPMPRPTVEENITESDWSFSRLNGTGSLRPQS